MKKTWQERIDDARARGHFTRKDELDMYHWGTCFVGEALEEIGVQIEGVLVGPEAYELIALGGGTEGVWAESFYRAKGVKPTLHPVFLVLENDFDGAERRLHEIHDVINKLYPPPEVEIPLSTATKKAKTMTKKQKATVVP